MGLNINDLKISSGAFNSGQRIPDAYAYDKGNTSPALTWSGVPAGTKQLAVICHDPDAPLPWGFTHWVVYGIPADVTEIAEGDAAPYTQGTTSFGEQTYGGPMPPEGHGDHHYYFWVYALDTEVDAQPGLTREELLAQISDHIIEQNRSTGTYAN